MQAITEQALAEVSIPGGGAGGGIAPGQGMAGVTGVTEAQLNEASGAVAALAGKMAHALGSTVKSYANHLGLSRAEAHLQLQENLETPEQRKAFVESKPPDQTTWYDLGLLSAIDPDLSISRWQEIANAAHQELVSGQRASAAIEVGDDACWTKAQFMAIRRDLHESFQPTNGIERQLLDQYALAQTQSLYWHRILTVRSQLTHIEDRSASELGQWVSPRVSDALAIDAAAAAIDRFNKIALRTLRAFQNLRRFNTVVVVKKGGQVNLAAQQVNVSRPRKAKASKAKARAAKSTRKRVTPATGTDTTTPTAPTTAGTTPDNSTTTATHTKGTK